MAGQERKWLRWFIGGVIVVLAVAFGGPFVYDHVTSAPAMLSLPTDAPGAGTAPASASLDGLWHAGSSSLAGFRVPTSALGYRSTVVGRTDKVRGSIAITANAVTSATLTVDVAAINTSASGRKLMDVSAYPTATFTLTRPIRLSGTPVDGTVRHYAAIGALTFHGTTHPVSIMLSEERSGSTLYVLTDIPAHFADWHISVPYGVEDHGTLEVLLGLVQGAENRA